MVSSAVVAQAKPRHVTGHLSPIPISVLIKSFCVLCQFYLPLKFIPFYTYEFLLLGFIVSLFLTQITVPAPSVLLCPANQSHIKPDRASSYLEVLP